MGERTFGKGSVQTVLPLGNGTGIKLTTARYFTPNGRSIQNKGITPDIIVEEGKVVGDDNQGGFGVREADLENHLTNPNTPSESGVTTTPPKIIGPDKPAKPGKATKLEPGEVISKDDFQLNQAVSLLKGINILNKSADK